MRSLLFLVLTLASCLLANAFKYSSYAIPTGTCGLTKYTNPSVFVPRPYIVGGQVVKQNSYPWQVSLQSNGEHTCGGSIINDRYILTAAHCFSGAGYARFWKVIAGKHSLLRKETTQQTYDVSTITKHENYGEITSLNDIALIKVTKAIRFTDEIQPICLPDASIDSRVGTNATVTGWGSTQDGGSGSYLLREVELPIITNEKCQKSYPDEKITDKQLCAGYDAGGKDSCQGDSGGPFQQLIDGKYVQIGVTSWGYGCAQKGYPGVYTRVNSYLDWMKTNMV